MSIIYRVSWQVESGLKKVNRSIEKIVDHTVFENINQTPCVEQNINSQTSFEIFFNLNVQSSRLDI